MAKTMIVSFLFCGLSLFVMAGDGFSLEIVYPADKTAVVRSNYLIIKGGSDPELDGMVVELNGAATDLIDISSADYKVAFADFLILQPEFDPGRNQIKVAGYSKGKLVATKSVDCYFVIDPTETVPKQYKLFKMHTAEKEQLCTKCHNMQPTRDDFQKSPTQHPCAECHRLMLDKKFVHGPAGVYQCDFCHDPQSSPARYQTQGGGGDVCSDCHEDQTRAFDDLPFVHGPVAAGLCSVCHDAHGSDYTAQILAPVNDLCYGCHESVKGNRHVTQGVSGKNHPLMGVKNPVNGLDLSCVSCHNPHAGRGPQYFQYGISERFSLCQKCHQK